MSNQNSKTMENQMQNTENQKVILLSNAEIDAIKWAIIQKFASMNGSNFVGVREYLNDSQELANHVVNADFSYFNACNTTMASLNSLTDSDFEALANANPDLNVSGIRYSENAEYQRKYIDEGKDLPKEGTKAREAVLKSIKTTKTFAEIRTDMVQSFLNNRNDETRSAQSEAQREMYEKVTNSIKIHKASGKVYIYALAVWKDVIVDGVYEDKKSRRETLQKNIITKYCKDKGLPMPTTKYRNFIIDVDKMAMVKAKGEEFELV